MAVHGRTGSSAFVAPGLIGFAAATLAALPNLALASSSEPTPALNGASLPFLWALPFAGLLLSIAIVPLVNARFWHAHFGKIAAAWSAALVLPFAFRFGFSAAIYHVVHAIVADYLPFVVILFALYTISGGIGVRGSFAGKPFLNACILTLGAAMASFIGTTGAAMLLIRPLLTANEARSHNAHTVLFFILLVGNVGGALSPLGDPPLFLGFLQGVDFFWQLRNLLAPTTMLAAALLVIYFALDTWHYRKDRLRVTGTAIRPHVAIEGKLNLLLMAAVIGAVLMSGLWHPGVEFDVLGTKVPLEKLLRDFALVALALASLSLTSGDIRTRNAFHWGPIAEVAKLFAGIFVTIVPVIAMLAAGREGPLAPVIDLVVSPAGVPDNLKMYWTTGVLSAFLDNAPTYLVFFNLAGGDAIELTSTANTTLKAISMAAVYFGTLTYIGNAPNFMIKAVAEDRGVAMPSFVAYVMQASLVMLPLLALIGALFL